MLACSPSFRLKVKALVQWHKGIKTSCSRASAGGFRRYALARCLLSLALAFKAARRIPQANPPCQSPRPIFAGCLYRDVPSLYIDGAEKHKKTLCE